MCIMYKWCSVCTNCTGWSVCIMYPWCTVWIMYPVWAVCRNCTGRTVCTRCSGCPLWPMFTGWTVRTMCIVCSTYKGHKWIGPPSLLVEGLLSTGPTPSSFYLLVETGLPLHLYPTFIWWELDQLFIKRHHQKRFEKKQIRFMPNLLMFRGIFGLPGQN